MRIKWRVVITETIEVVTDLSGITPEKVINMAHGPEGPDVQRQRTDGEVTAVEIDGTWYEAPPF